MKRATAGLKLRKATIDDGPFLLAVRNSDDVRAQSKSKAVIENVAHSGWLNEALSSEDASVWILESAGQRLGYVRAHKVGKEGEVGTWLLSLALHSSARGQGYGSWAIREFCRVMRETVGSCELVAEVLPTNEIARRLFNELSFTEAVRPHDDFGLVQYKLRIDATRHRGK